MNDRTRQQRFITEHQTMVWRYLRLLGCDPSLADDMTQETFLAVLRKPFEEKHPKATCAYLRTVARHTFIDSLRRARKQVDMAAVAEADMVWADHYPDDEGEERLRALRACMETLDGRGRELVNARFAMKLAFADIAAQRDMGESAVKMAVARAIEGLRDCMQRKLKP